MKEFKIVVLRKGLTHWEEVVTYEKESVLFDTVMTNLIFPNFLNGYNHLITMNTCEQVKLAGDDEFHTIEGLSIEMIVIGTNIFKTKSVSYFAYKTPYYSTAEVTSRRKK
jgi:hypothetical protein